MFCVEQRKPCVSKVPRRAILSFRGSLRSRTISVSGAVSTLRQKREDINNEGKKKTRKAMFTESRFQRKIAQNYLRVLFPFCLCVLWEVVRYIYIFIVLCALLFSFLRSFFFRSRRTIVSRWTVHIYSLPRQRTFIHSPQLLLSWLSLSLFSPIWFVCAVTVRFDPIHQPCSARLIVPLIGAQLFWIGT